MKEIIDDVIFIFPELKYIIDYVNSVLFIILKNLIIFELENEFKDLWGIYFIKK